MILYNSNDQLITLPGVRVGAVLVAGATIQATLTNVTTGSAVFLVSMQDSVGNTGNYEVQPPLFNVPAGTNYKISYTGVVQGFTLTLEQNVEVQNRTR